MSKALPHGKGRGVMRHYRISDQMPLKTKRLLIAPMSEKEIVAYEEREKDSLLRAALAEMKRNVTEFPDQALWHTGWLISVRQGGDAVGIAAFHGVPADRTVDIGYDILPQYRGNGYAEEAVKALSGWAFARENVYFIRAMADSKNDASNHILRKMGFYRIESSVEGQECWELERPPSSWFGSYLAIGLALGLALGQSFFGNMILGMLIGMSAGLALGAAMDSQDRAARKRNAEPKKLDQPVTNSKKKK
jgi:RimJ/RimL family protein N-acetyltransferase